MLRLKTIARTCHELLKAPLSTLTNTLMIGIALSLPIIGYSLVKSVEILSFSIEHKPHINVYVSPSLRSLDAKIIEQELEFTEGVKKIKTISKLEALKAFEEISGISNILDSLNTNPLPTTIIITPRDDYLNTTGIQLLKDEIAKIEGIDEIQVNQEWLERLNSVTSFSHTLLLVFTVLIACAVILTLSNTIRLLISTRSKEIIVSKLVGANDSYVKLPFLYLGIFYALLGGVISYGIYSLVLLALQIPVNNFASSYDQSFKLYTLSGLELLIILLSSALLGWIAASLSVGKHLNAIKPR